MGLRAIVCLVNQPRMEICVNLKHKSLWLNDFISISEKLRIDPTNYLYDDVGVEDSNLAFDITMGIGVTKGQIGTGQLGTFRLGVEPNALLGSEVVKIKENLSITIV